MVRSLTILFIAIVFNSKVAAQNKANTPDTTKSIQKDVLSEAKFNEVIQRQFATLLTGQSTNTVGSFAALNVQEPNVTFAPNHIFNNGNIISIKASGGISDGVFSVFNNSRLNSNVAIDMKYHALSRRKASIIFLSEEWRLVQDSVAKAKDQFKTDSSHIVNDPKASKDRVWRKRELLKLRNIRAGKLKKYGVDNLDIRGFLLGWWSFGYAVRNDAFRLFDPSSSFADQIVKRNYVSHDVSLRYSFYNWDKTAYKNIFVSFGLSFSNTSSLPDMDKVEIEDTKEYGEEQNKRQSTSSFIAYTGEFEKNIRKVKLDVDLYYFPFKSTALGLHLNPNVSYRIDDASVTNIGTGLFFTFKNKDKDKPVINAELFYNLIDVFGTDKRISNIHKYNNIGIKLAFPIDFKL